MQRVPPSGTLGTTIVKSHASTLGIVRRRGAFFLFRTSGLCVICNYVLHTLEYCTSSTRRILCFVLSHFQKTELKFGGINSNGLTNELSSSFLFSRILLFSSYLVPTYIRYLRRKTVVRNENRPIRGGYGIVSQFKQACASPDSGLAQREKRHYYPYPIRRRKYITT